MSQKNKLATDKQLKAMQNLKINIPEKVTILEASCLIGAEVDRIKSGLPKMGCKTCEGVAMVTRISKNKIKIFCCGITEYRYKDVEFGKKDSKGRLHGNQLTLGTGEVRYDHGTLEFLDDGNGNIYDANE